MPYNIWCDGCKNHIGMGRFAEVRPRNGSGDELKMYCDAIYTRSLASDFCFVS